MAAAATVSIVIPNRDYGRFLGDAIASAQAQTAACEVLVADYGSSDDSLAIAARAGVRVLRSDPHRGLAGAFAHGVREAKGDFVVMLGADDVLDPRFAERCLARLRDAPAAGWVYPGAVQFGPYAPFGGARMHALPFSRRCLQVGNTIVATALVRRALLLRHGGYDETLGYWEDWDLWLRLSQAGHVGLALDEPLLRYRQHSPTQRNRRSRAELARMRREVRRRNGVRAGPASLAWRGLDWSLRAAGGALMAVAPRAAGRWFGTHPRARQTFRVSLVPAAERSP